MRWEIQNLASMTASQTDQNYSSVISRHTTIEAQKLPCSRNSLLIKKLYATMFDGKGWHASCKKKAALWFSVALSPATDEEGRMTTHIYFRRWQAWPCLFILLLFVPLPVGAQWGFDWATRTDRDGNPAGVFTMTPFPVDENSTSYSITNDEGTKTFTLGTRYFVDGAKADDTGDGLSLANAKKTIGAAMTAAGNGNKTIIVRGAHDAFDGIYHETGLESHGGIGAGDTARFMIVGYKQERPILNGDQSITPIYGRTNSIVNRYLTFQRLKFQNNQREGVYLGNGNYANKYDAYVSIIDCEFYQTSWFPPPIKSGTGNAQIYWMNADHAWGYHVTVHHGLGHGIKIGDGSSYGIIEWCVVYEAGYWTGIAAEYSITDWCSQYGDGPTGIGLPNDDNVEAASMTVRYNIVHDVLYYGIQLRNTSDVSCHHNEVYNTPNLSSVPGTTCRHVDHSPQILIYNQAGYYFSGSVYSNVIHDSGDVDACGISENFLADNHSCYIYNNLIYNNPYAEIYLIGSGGFSTRNMRVFNNTLYHGSATTPAILTNTGWGAGEVSIENNIISKAGAGACVTLDTSITTDYNLYYYPSGSKGSGTFGAHDFASGASMNPLFVLTPSGTFTWGMGAIQSASPARSAGVNLSGIFTVDIDMRTRSVWDIGAFAYSGVVPAPPTAGSGLRVKP
jgi:hypothetical protein